MSNSHGQMPNDPHNIPSHDAQTKANIDPQYHQGYVNPQFAPAPEKQKNTLGLIAFIVAVVGFIFACIPGALIVGWVLLPIAFILSIVALCLRGKKLSFAIAGLVTSIVGTLVGVIVFFTVVGTAFDDAVDEISSGTDVSVSEPASDAGSQDGQSGAGDDRGTRENPHPLGTTISDDDWSVTINSVDLNAQDAVMAENPYNDPAPEGMTYILVNATVTYIGDSDEGEMPWSTIEYVTADGSTISSVDGSNFAVTPDPLDTMSDLYQGGSTTGNVLLTVPAETAAEGVLAVEPGMFSRKTFVAVT